MTQETMESLFNVRQLTPGRVAFAAKQVAAVAEEQGDAEVAAEATDLVALSKGTVKVERAWQSGQLEPAGRGRGEALPGDNRVDRLVGAVHTVVGAHAEATDAQDELHEIAKNVLRTAFPRGAAGITRLSYEDQSAAVDVLLSQLQGQFANDAPRLGIASLVPRLDAAQQTFKESLQKKPRKKVGFEEVRKARANTAEGLAQLMALIAGKYRKQEEADQRAALLAPILEQNERVGEAYQRRRTVNDVDPDTGKETEPSSPSQPVNEPTPGGV